MTMCKDNNYVKFMYICTNLRHDSGYEQKAFSHIVADFLHSIDGSFCFMLTGMEG